MADESQIQAALIKEIRRGILDTLGMAYPAALTYETICGVFVDIESHNIKRDLTYLVHKDRGYIEWLNPQKSASYKGRKYRLTPAGLDIVQRINTDPALEP